MRYWTGAATAFFLALLQASSIEEFKVLGVTPNVLLVLLVAWLVVRGLEDVLPMVAVSGITLGLVGMQTPGLDLLALLPLAVLGIVRELRLVHSDLVLTLALVAAGTAAYQAVLVLAVMAGGGRLDPLTAARAAVLPAVLVNVALALPVYGVMRLARPVGRRHRLTYA